MTNIKIGDLASELASLLGRVSGEWVCSETSPPPLSDLPNDRVGLDEVEGALTAWVMSSDQRRRVEIRCTSETPLPADDLLLMKKIVLVFNYDLKAVGDSLSTKEIWAALSSTRFLRAALRLSAISTDHLIRRIRIFEAAARQTYEGSAFAGSVVMSHNLQTLKDHAGKRYRSFSSSLEFDQALLREKWLRPFLEGGDFALVAVSRKGVARGFTDVSQSWPSPVDSAPVAELEGLYGYLRPGISVLPAAPTGDIHFALSSGVTFRSSKGHWRYQNWAPLENILTRHCVPNMVQPMLRLIKSSSYLHRGALYVVLNKEADILNVIPDHGNAERSAETLRSTVMGVSIIEPTSIRLLGVASRIDGAVVLNKKGNVMDVASMVAEPSVQALKQAGQHQLQRFAGARTTAAWNASMHGLAVKISDDGPVDVYEAGHHIFHSE